MMENNVYDEEMYSYSIVSGDTFPLCGMAQHIASQHFDDVTNENNATKMMYL